MSEDTLRTLLYVGLGFGVVAVVMFLEILFRNLINRVGDNQEAALPQVTNRK